MSVKNNSKDNSSLALILFILFFGTYLLGYGGKAVTDDEQLFSSAAINLVLHGELSAGQLSGNDRMDGSYSGVGPMHPIFAFPLLFIIKKTSLGMVQALYLLTPLYTALSAVLLFKILLIEGYETRNGFLGAIAFGFSTIVFPYSKTFFREPLAMLLLLLALLMFEHLIQPSKNNYQKTLSWVFFLVFLISAIYTKFFLIISIPAFMYLYLKRCKYRIWDHHKKLKRNLVFVLFGFLIMMIISTGVNSVIKEDLITRLSFKFIKDMLLGINRLPHDSFFNAIGGLLFSPGKGFFVYSPLLIYSMMPVKNIELSAKSMRTFAWFILIGMVIQQALVYNDQWWSITWGTRSLLPAIPVMFLAAMPAIKRILNSQNLITKTLLCTICLIGIIAQVSSILIDEPTYMSVMYEKLGLNTGEKIVWDFRYMPLYYHAKLLLTGSPIALSAWRIAKEYQESILKYVGPTVALMLTSICLIFFTNKSKKCKKPNLFIPICIITTIFLSVTTLKMTRRDPWYYPERDDIQNVINELPELLKSNEIVIVDDYLSPIWYQILNFNKDRYYWYSLPINGDNRTKNQILDIVILTDFLTEFKEVQNHDLWIVTSSPHYTDHDVIYIENTHSKLSLCYEKRYTSKKYSDETYLYKYCVE